MAAIDPIRLSTVLDDVVRSLRVALNPSDICMFDSYSKGTPHAASNLDIFFIVAKGPQLSFDRDAAATKSFADSACQRMSKSTHARNLKAGWTARRASRRRLGTRDDAFTGA